MNYFVEGIQGAGKTTMVNNLAQNNPDYTLFREGDYSPVELAWCAYVDGEDYFSILKRYADIEKEIIGNTTDEDGMKVVTYTKILTDIPGFHKDLEQYEIYNGNKNPEEFEKIILERFRKWSGKNQIFECSIFQNIIENLMLYLCLTDEEIVDFYKKVFKALEGKEYRIVYLTVSDIRKAEEIIKKERSDDAGNELWFPLMTAYIENSPYGKTHHLEGMDGLVTHLDRRVKIEKRIISEIFKDHAEIKYREIDA